MTQSQAARALLEGVEAGAPVGALIDALLVAVLGAPVVQLALAVRDGGPLRVRRALELADVVLAQGEGGARASAV